MLIFILYFNNFIYYNNFMNDSENFIKIGFVLKRKLFSQKEINKLDKFIQQRIEKEASADNVQTSTGKLSMSI